MAQTGEERGRSWSLPFGWGWDVTLGQVIMSHICNGTCRAGLQGCRVHLSIGPSAGLCAAVPAGFCMGLFSATSSGPLEALVLSMPAINIGCEEQLLSPASP